MGIVGRRKIPWLSNIRVSRESPVAELGRWTLPYISLSSRISSMVLARVKSPSLLSDRLLPRGQALRPGMGLAPNSPRVSEAKCELQVEDWSFRSVSALSPSDSFLGHCPRNRKFFPSTQALQPQWRRASKKRPQDLRSSAFTCQVRQRWGDYLGVPDACPFSRYWLHDYWRLPWGYLWLSQVEQNKDKKDTQAQMPKIL